MTALLAAEHPGYRCLWICEKWSEDAVDFARRYFDKLDISHIPTPDGNGFMSIKDGISSAFLRMLTGEAEIIEQIEGNLLLNEGIQRFEDLTMVTSLVNNQTAGNPWTNSNAQLGVGDSSTAEAATQTELQAATNRFYAAMNASQPSRSSQTVSFVSDFTSGQANYAWAEWTIATGSSGSPPSGTINLNRKVASLGTKATGTWTLTAQVTFS